MTEKPKRALKLKSLLVHMSDGRLVTMVAGDTLNLDIVIDIQQSDPPVIAERVTGMKVAIKLQQDGSIAVVQGGDPVTIGPPIVHPTGFRAAMRALFSR